MQLQLHPCLKRKTKSKTFCHMRSMPENEFYIEAEIQQKRTHTSLRDVTSGIHSKCACCMFVRTIL